MITASTSSTYSQSIASNRYHSLPPFKKFIQIQVNSKPPITISLNLDAQLSAVRKFLSEEPSVYMNQNMYFITLDSRIPQKNEGDVQLFDILEDNTLHISLVIEPDWPRIIKKSSLEYGVKFSKVGPIRKNPDNSIKVFEFRNFPANFFKKPETMDESITVRNDGDKFCVTNHISRAQVETELKWPSFCERLDVSLNPYTEQKIISAGVYRITKHIKAVIKMTQDNVVPTEEYKSAIDQALNSSNPKLELEGVLNRYGPFWCQRIVLGGKIMYIDHKRIPPMLQRHEEIKAGPSNGVDSNLIMRSLQIHGKESIESINFNKDRPSFQIFGGKENAYDENGVLGWIRSLDDDPNTWEIIEYQEITSIFDLLDNRTQQRISNALGPIILESRLETINFSMDTSLPKPYIFSLPSSEHFKKVHQIFATLMTDDETRDVFSLRVHYEDKHTPSILIHRVARLKRKSEIKKFTLKLGWIILGSLPNFCSWKYDPNAPLFTSGEVEMVALKDRYSASLDLDKFVPNMSYLVMPVSRSGVKSSRDPKNFEFITGAHLVVNDKLLHACGFCYELDTLKPHIRLLDLSLNFTVNYCIIEGPQQPNFNNVKIFPKRSSWSFRFPRNFNIYFSQYQILSSFMLTGHFPQNEINETTLPTTNTIGGSSKIQHPVFLSLQLSSYSSNFNPGFFMISPNNLLFRSMKQTFGKHARVAYFCAPTFES
ncbi:hypothetical protein G9A89_019086 [Geosiphon pyriformis]|nr:hypothetical protein G9A89_019086 [Geosiphon pyriformis]